MGINHLVSTIPTTLTMKGNQSRSVPSAFSTLSTEPRVTNFEEHQPWWSLTAQVAVLCSLPGSVRGIRKRSQDRKLRGSTIWGLSTTADHRLGRLAVRHSLLVGLRIHREGRSRLVAVRLTVPNRRRLVGRNLHDMLAKRLQNLNSAVDAYRGLRHHILRD
jgi:hypothetical protein